MGGAEIEGAPDLPKRAPGDRGAGAGRRQNRTALVALTALKNYDNYTFTHMVNVSILTMAPGARARHRGPAAARVRPAALMHDIGKVRTPKEILNKPDKLTDDEFAIMRSHVVDGAEILRRTPEMPILAPVVAFEHHLRQDGTGYPVGVERGALNLGTMLCSISDVYDAMRSQRAYQQAFPTDRILAVMKRNDGTQFDQHLVRRFVQLLGIYPPGNLVRLTTEKLRSSRRCTRRTRTAPASACSTPPMAHGSTCPTTATCGSRLAPGTRRPQLLRRSIPPSSASTRSITWRRGSTHAWCWRPTSRQQLRSRVQHDTRAERLAHAPCRRGGQAGVDVKQLYSPGVTEGFITFVAFAALGLGLTWQAVRTSMIPASSPDRLVSELRLAQIIALLLAMSAGAYVGLAVAHEAQLGVGFDVALAIGFFVVAAATLVRDPHQALTMLAFAFAAHAVLDVAHRPGWPLPDEMAPRWYQSVAPSSMHTSAPSVTCRSCGGNRVAWRFDNVDRDEGQLMRSTISTPVLAIALLLWSSFAHPAAAQSDGRFVVGINGGVQTGATRLTDHFEFESNVETATVEVTYPSKAAVLIDGSVVVHLWNQLGAGVAVSQATRDGAAEVDALIPHPLLFQQPRTVTGSQSGISGAQTGVHFQLSFAVAVTPRVIVTLSGGPSYVHVSQDLVTDVNYSESYPSRHRHLHQRADRTDHRRSRRVQCRRRRPLDVCPVVRHRRNGPLHTRDSRSRVWRPNDLRGGRRGAGRRGYSAGVLVPGSGIRD